MDYLYVFCTSNLSFSSSFNSLLCVGRAIVHDHHIMLLDVAGNTCVDLSAYDILHLFISLPTHSCLGPFQWPSGRALALDTVDRRFDSGQITPKTLNIINIVCGALMLE